MKYYKVNGPTQHFLDAVCPVKTEWGMFLEM